MYVNPESVLYPNVVEKYNFGEEYKVGLDDISLAQTEEQGFPVFVNPESVLYPNAVEKYNFGEEYKVGLHDISLLQQKE